MKAFTDSMLIITTATQELDQAVFTPTTKALFQQMLIPRLVTAIECYFRDSLDAIFRLCKHTAFLPALNKLIKQKYSAQEIIELEAEGLHFLEIIPREMSFQALDLITAAYDNFIPTGFTNEMKQKQYRFKHHPDSMMEVTDQTLAQIAELFSLRHQIVHNPHGQMLSQVGLPISANRFSRHRHRAKPFMQRRNGRLSM